MQRWSAGLKQQKPIRQRMVDAYETADFQAAMTRPPKIFRWRLSLPAMRQGAELRTRARTLFFQIFQGL